VGDTRASVVRFPAAAPAPRDAIQSQTSKEMGRTRAKQGRSSAILPNGVPVLALRRKSRPFSTSTPATNFSQHWTCPPPVRQRYLAVPQNCGANRKEFRPCPGQLFVQAPVHGVGRGGIRAARHSRCTRRRANPAAVLNKGETTMGYDPRDHIPTARQVLAAWVVCLAIIGLAAVSTAAHDLTGAAADPIAAAASAGRPAMNGVRTPQFALCRPDPPRRSAAAAQRLAGPISLPIDRCS